MKFIPSRIHGVLDYLVGALLIFAPQFFDFDPIPAARNICIALGAGAILYSLLTAYELGAFKLIPFRVHLGLDIASGLLLLTSPWLFGFADQTLGFHVTLGAIEVVTALSTRPAPGRFGGVGTIKPTPSSTTPAH
jgi:hypothetical protein